jgi:membrane fusion protein, multidrug efflux system
MHRSRISFPPARSAIALAALSLVLVACGKQGGPQGHGGMPPADVVVTTVALRDVPVEFEYVGQVAGSREVEVRARVTGIIEKRLYEEGAVLKAGQPMFLIDPAPFRARMASAEAAMAQAQARLKQADREYSRIKPLADEQAVSRKEADDAASALDLARAAVKSAEADLTSARIDLGYTEVRAPLGGVSGRALKVEGALASATGDSLLATLAQTDPANVNYGVGEEEALRLRDEAANGKLVLPKAGFAVKLKLSDGSVLDRVGRIDFHDYKADSGTGSFAARATVANADGKLAPGQFVRVLLGGATRPQAVVLPQRAVLDSPNGKFVYVVGQGKEGATIAQPRPVQVGEWVKLEGDLANAWVIRDGLKPGDQVIVDGTARIFFPGAPVKVGAAPAAQSAPQAPKQ